MLMSANPQQFWDEFPDVDPPPSQDFKDLIQAMLQENPKARLTMADVIGHPWVQGNCATQDDFKAEYHNIISDMRNYPAYSVDFDRNQAKEALRGDDDEEDDFDYEEHFKFDKWENVPMYDFDEETGSRHRIMTQGRPI
jgi:serine/threonine protein kinase